MALRLRKNGKLLCAAMHSPEQGDTYLDDAIHEVLSGVRGTTPVIGSEPMGKHQISGEWWWLGNVPPNVIIDDYYTRKR